MNIETGIPLTYSKPFIVYATKYSRMDQVKFVEDSLSSTNFIWSILEYFVPYGGETQVLTPIILSMQLYKRKTINKLHADDIGVYKRPFPEYSLMGLQIFFSK